VSEDSTREDPTRGHGFDELARSLAEGSISRRRTLKLFATPPPTGSPTVACP